MEGKDFYLEGNELVAGLFTNRLLWLSASARVV
jgi:hypothetical protein